MRNLCIDAWLYPPYCLGMRTALKSLIQAVEIWTPNKSGCLELKRGAYGPHTSFRKASLKATFAPCEGLPGQVWASRAPQIFTKLGAADGFVRSEAAQEAGFTAGIGLPVIPRGEVEAVIVLLFATSETLSSVFEIWSPDAVGKLALSTGFYGGLCEFERLSWQTRFSVLEGLPGQTFDARRPVLFNNLSRDGGFVRSEAAAKAGLSAGLGLPMLEGDTAKSAVLLLTSRANPLAQVIEVWEPRGGALRLSAGYYGEHGALERSSQALLQKGQDLPGEVYEVRFPVLRDLAESKLPRHRLAADAGLETAVGIPIFTKGKVSSVVVLMS